MLSPVQLFVTPWTVACQAPLSMELCRQEYWSGLSHTSPGDLHNPGIKPSTPALAGEFFITVPPGKPNNDNKRHNFWRNELQKNQKWVWNWNKMKLWVLRLPPPPFYRIALRLIKDFFQNKISDKSYTEIKHTLYVQILKIILNDFYTCPCNPWHFVKII